jgi:hypothetical protein
MIGNLPLQHYNRRVVSVMVLQVLGVLQVGSQ